MKKVYTLMLWCLVTQGASAQLSEVWYQSFEIKEVSQVKVDFEDADKYQTEHWEGNTVLVEISVKIHNATQSILKSFIQNNRYNVEPQLNAPALKLIQRSPPSGQLSFKGKLLEEEVAYKILIPRGIEVL